MTTQTKSLRQVTRRAAILPLCALPFLLGADNGGGCGSFSSKSPAPNVTGSWAITYGTTMEVDVKVGGSVYHQSLAPNGGSFTFTHQGAPFSFNIDCTRPEVVCPSEVWPTQVAIDQRDATYQHRMWVLLRHLGVQHLDSFRCSALLISAVARTNCSMLACIGVPNRVRREATELIAHQK